MEPPGATIGNTHSSRSTRTSTMAGPSWSNASASVVVELGRVGDAQPEPAVRLGELHEVGAVLVEHGRRVALAVEELLPLAHHAEVAVVEHDHLDRDVVDLAVAISWLFIWIEPSPAMSMTRWSGRPTCAPIAAGRPKPIVPRPPEETHVRGSVRCVYWHAHIWFWPTSVQMTRLRSLVMRSIVCTTCSGAMEFSLSRVVQRELLAPVVDRAHPRLGLGLGAGLAQLGDEAGEDRLGVAHDRHVDRLVLADLGRVDVDVDDLGLARERRELAGHAVVEAHADRDEQVGLGDRVVGVLRAVHAGHAEAQVVVLGERALAHQRGRRPGAA